MEHCTQGPRIENLQEDIRELKEITKLHGKEIADLKNAAAETRIYVKQIFERLDELKAVFDMMFKEPERMAKLNAAFSEMEKRLLRIEERGKGRKETGELIKDWGGWVFGILMSLISLYLALGR